MGRKLKALDTYYARHKEEILEAYRAKTYAARLIKGLWRGTVFERFWGKVNIVPDSRKCWRWRGQRSRKGYGEVNFGLDRERAHRVAWECAHKRPIPKGLIIRHTCDNPPCCNPRHLKLSTVAENNADMVAKRRAACFRVGEQSNRAVLSKDQVDWARNAYAARGGTWEACKTIAVELSVTPGHINNIMKGRFWKKGA